MLELSSLLSLKVRTCGTIDCVWDTRCGARSLPHLTGTFMRSHGRTTPLTFWLDRLVDPPMDCTTECSTGFVKMTRQQAPRSGTQREAAALLFATVVGGAHDAHATLDRTPAVPTDVPFTSAPVGSRWFALEDTAGFTTGDAIIIESDDITSSCGLRSLVCRGGITFAAASSGLAPIQVVASDSDVRTLPVRFDSCGQRA